MKQYSELELNRALRIQEADIISLEQKYMVQLTKLFQTKEFSKNLSELENYIQANYNFIKKRYSKKNKVDIAVERTCRFHVYTKYKEIIKIYPSPISSDIAFETKDAIINIDSKTIDKHKNSGDFKSFHFENNQSSFKQEPLGKTNYYKGLQIKTALPTIDPATKKPLLNFVIRILYNDTHSTFTFYKDANHKNISLTCLPNGELSSLFKNQIITIIDKK